MHSPPTPPVPGEGRLTTTAMAGGHGSSEWFMCEDFVRAILDDTTPAIDVFFGLDMTLPGICAHISAENGSEPVVVPDPREW